MKIQKQYLFVWASIIWMAAGFNILRIGIEAYQSNFTFFRLLLSLAVFFLFQFFVFGRLVKKHSKRILEYEEPQWFFRFFDRKSFIIMAVMITAGVLLRSSGAAPDAAIAVFYTGLGSALFLAGISFGFQFIGYYL